MGTVVEVDDEAFVVDEPAELFLTVDGGATIRFKTPQRAVTPGQFVVVYDGEIVVGGGEIL